VGNGKPCTFCGKQNHTVENYFFKNGFPANFKFKDKINHVAVNNATSTHSHASSHASHTQSLNISKEEYDWLIGMLKKINPQDHSFNQLTHDPHSTHSPKGISHLSNSFWIIDSGDTHTICNNLALFVNRQSISPIKIKLPNGGFCVASQCGRIHFNDKLFLTMCIISLTSNLI
jgi:hypothetical protein